MALKHSLFGRLKFDNIYNQFLGMQPREQTFALVGSGVALLLLIVVPIMMANSKISKLQRTITQGQGQMGEIVRAIEDYNKKKTELGEVEGVLKGGYDASLSSTIENLASQEGLKESVDSLKERPTVPSDLYNEIGVEVKLSKVSLKDLANFLYQIEHSSSRVLRINKLRIKPRYDNQQQLDATFEVLTYQLTGEA